MSDLADRYRKRVAFDEKAAKARGKHWAPSSVDSGMDEQTAYIYGWLHGEREQHARRAKIDEAVSQVIEHLDGWRNAWASQDTSGAEPARRKMFEAMNKLAEVLGE